MAVAVPLLLPGQASVWDNKILTAHSSNFARKISALPVFVKVVELKVIVELLNQPAT